MESRKFFKLVTNIAAILKAVIDLTSDFQMERRWCGITNKQITSWEEQ